MKSTIFMIEKRVSPTSVQSNNNRRQQSFIHNSPNLNKHINPRANIKPVRLPHRQSNVANTLDPLTKQNSDDPSVSYEEKLKDERNLKTKLLTNIFHSIDTIKISLKKAKSNTRLGRAYDLILLVLSILSSIEFIYQTYLNPHSTSSFLSIFRSLEKCLACLFGFDWFLNLFLADHKAQFLTSFFSIVDLLTVIPIWITSSTKCTPYDYITSFRDALVYICCGLSTTRILRASRIRFWLVYIEDQVQRCLAEMCLVIFALIFFNAALMQYLEVQAQDLHFHTWIYYMWVTVATVGYGDIAPKTLLGRFAAMACIAFAVVSIPKMTNELIEILAQQSVYQRIKYSPKTTKSVHVLICGDLRSCSLIEFFNELFHEDHENSHLHAVVINPEPPSAEMMYILRDPIFSLLVTYLEGSVLSDRDLKRACADTAEAVFFLTNKFTTNPDGEDARLILEQFSVKRYISLNPRSKALFCMQLIRPENRKHLLALSSDISSDEEDVVICLNEVKMGIIAKSVIFPGTSTLIMNLLSSFSDSKDSDNSNTDDSNIEIENLNDDGADNWINEYERGCDWEIYTTKLSEIFINAKFSKLSEYLYDKLGILLFALEIEDIKKDNNKSNKKLLLNPADYVIPSFKDYDIVAFVLAKNKAQSDLSFNKSTSETYKSSDIQNTKMHMSHLHFLTTNIARRFSVTSELADDLSYDNIYLNHKKNQKKQFQWQLLKNSSKYNIKTNDNQEEIAYKQVEDLIKRDHYIRDNPVDINDITILTNVIDEIPHIDKHLIIIGKSLNNLYDLILPLRAKYLDRLNYIIILFPEEISSSDWRRLNMFEGLLVMRGSGVEENDIRRAGIYRASEVVILADTSSGILESNNSSGLDNEEALVDAESIFTYQCVKRLNENVHVVVEIVKQTNVSYLDPDSADLNYKFTPQFASGVLFTSGLLDTLVCQSFYNPRIVGLLDQLVNSKNRSNNEKEKVNDYQKSLNSTNSNDVSKKSSTCTSSSLYQIPIPEDLESKTYGSLFKYLSEKDIIPLGIFRGLFPNMQFGPKANKLSYVYTNPPKDTELFTCDRIFVLSQKPLNQTSNKAIKQSLKHMILHEKNISNKSVHSDDVISQVNNLSNHFKELETKQNKLENLLNNINNDINNKFNVLIDSINKLQDQINSNSTSSDNLNVIANKRIRPETDDAKSVVISELKALGSGGYRLKSKT